MSLNIFFIYGVLTVILLYHESAAKVLKKNRTCNDDQFFCDGGSKNTCIPLVWKCDGNADCIDKTDELDCSENKTCKYNEFSCDGSLNRCIPLVWRCDEDADCIDKTDELDCSDASGTSTKFPPSFTEVNLNETFSGNITESKTCLKWEWSCGDNTCLPFWWRCDGVADCIDKTDELSCPDASGTSTAPSPSVTDAILNETSSDNITERTCDINEFQCEHDGGCIPLRWRCDGASDCTFGSDEVNCTERKCDINQFQCDKDKRCIPSRWRCDGESDCPFGSDEVNCTDANETSTETPPTSTSTILNETSSDSITDESLCGKKPFRCDENNCIHGSWRCDGKPDCRDGSDEMNCSSTEGSANLIFTTRTSIWKISLDDKKEYVIVPDLQNPIALDFMFKTDTIIWADLKEDCIHKAPFDDGSQRKVIICDKDSFNSDIESVAVDWIYEKLYWITTAERNIEVALLNGTMRKTLFSLGMASKPRDIALYPQEGIMFWSDWRTDTPRIERAGMDGTHRQEIINEDIGWVNGIAIDYALRNLYWVDAMRDTISMCNFDGSKRIVVLETHEHLKHPFSIAIFEDYIYWSDWTLNGIYRTGKFPGHDKTVEIILEYISDPMTIHVYHSSSQPNGTNHCYPANGNCSHLCLPAPQLENPDQLVTCACPDGLKMAGDGVTCMTSDCFTGDDSEGCVNTTTETITPTTTIESSCVTSDFMITCVGSSECIPKLWKCDGSEDCANGWDEQDCPDITEDSTVISNTTSRAATAAVTSAAVTSETSMVSSTTPRTTTTRSIEVESTTDPILRPTPDKPIIINVLDNVGLIDILPHCPNSGFRCLSDQMCIDNDLVCDGIFHCSDKEDELTCNKEPCEEDEFKCEATGACISEQWRCDGQPDCAGMSDEISCQKERECPKSFLPFGSQRCLHIHPFPRRWLRAKQVCRNLGSNLASFETDSVTHAKLLKLLTDKALVSWNYWVDTPPGEKGSSPLLEEKDISIPFWLLNGDKYSDVITPIYAASCTFLDHSNLRPYLAINCNDFAGFICEIDYRNSTKNSVN